jgi:hypothetical protein
MKVLFREDASSLIRITRRKEKLFPKMKVSLRSGYPGGIEGISRERRFS